MKSHNSYKAIFSGLILISLLSTLVAQQNEADTGYVPEIGQKGKDVIWVPTPTELVDLMLSMAKVTSDDYVIDLGSGDGRTVIAAAKRGAHALGIEYNPDMVALSKRNAVKDGVSDKTEFIKADMFEFDISKATVITLFLLPEINLKLRPRLLELKPGTRIVSNTFTMGDWEPDYESISEENWNSWNSALMWIVPTKVDGKWKIGTDELDIRQEFQLLYGTYSGNGKTTILSSGRLSGDEITFKVGEDLYAGKVDGQKMIGTVAISSSGTKRDWLATKSEN